jgi:hypothetical protein
MTFRLQSIGCEAVKKILILTADFGYGLRMARPAPWTSQTPWMIHEPPPSGGAGVLAQTPLAVLESVSHWLEKGWQLFLQYAERESRPGRPRAAYEAAELIWASAEPQ